MQKMQEPESEIATAQSRPDWEGAGGNGAGGGGEIPGAGAEGGNYGVAGYGLVLCEARWYGDGQFYQAIRGPRTPMGGYLVTFTGHEEDPPQDTAALDVRLLQVPEARSQWQPTGAHGGFMAPPHALGAGAPHPRGNDGAQLPMGMLNGATSAVVYAGKAHPAELAHAMASAPPGAGLNAGWAPHAAPGAPGARLSVEDLFRMIGQDAVVGGELPRESPPGSQRSAPTPPLSSGSAVGRRASAGAGDRAPPSPPLSAGSAGGALADREFPLHDACSYGDEGRVRRLVEVRHFDVNARAQPPQLWCPLHCASASGHTGVARLLVELRADPSASDADGWTPLHLAASQGHSELAALLLESSALHVLKDHDGFTALHEAARNNHVDVVRQLVAAKADVNTRDSLGSELAPLLRAPAAFADAMAVGRTPLHWAAANGHVQVVELLCCSGADVEAADRAGDAPLALAAAHGKRAAVDVLAAAGARPGRKNESGWSALHHAAASGQVEAIEALVAEHALDIEAADSAAQRPLHLAVVRAHPRAAARLLALGADPNAPSALGLRALHLAARANARDAVPLLLGAGADPEARDDEGWSALHWACAADALEAAAALVAAGASAAAEDADGVRPLEVGTARVQFALFHALQPAPALWQPPVPHSFLPMPPDMGLGGSGMGMGAGVGAGDGGAPGGSQGAVPWQVGFLQGGAGGGNAGAAGYGFGGASSSGMAGAAAMRAVGAGVGMALQRARVGMGPPHHGMAGGAGGFAGAGGFGIGGAGGAGLPGWDARMLGHGGAGGFMPHEGGGFVQGVGGMGAADGAGMNGARYGVQGASGGGERDGGMGGGQGTGGWAVAPVAAGLPGYGPPGAGVEGSWTGPGAEDLGNSGLRASVQGGEVIA